MRDRASFRRMIIPPLTPGVHEDYVIDAAGQLQRLSRWLYAAMLVIVPFAIMVTPSGASDFVRWGLPLAQAAVSLVTLVMLRRDFDFPNHPRRAERFLLSGVRFSFVGAFICTAWAVLATIEAAPADKVYYPVILAMGALATSFCMASLRWVALLHLVFDLTPMILLLVLSGRGMEMAVAVSIVVCAMFQLMMIFSHQDRVVGILRLRRQSMVLAATDPLTGLKNRRALMEEAQDMAAKGPVCLALLDLDHFKAVNDKYGHIFGDEVLIHMAEDMREACFGREMIAARLGGEEFAIFGLAEEFRTATVAEVLGSMRNRLFSNGARVTVSAGVASGEMTGPEGWQDLYRRADSALYRAKEDGRDRMVEDGACAANPYARERLAC